MKAVLLSLLVSSAIAFPAMAALKAGDKAPDFSTEASRAGKAFQFSLKDALKKGPVVLYFYPSAFTAGCNAEAHTFAEDIEKFKAAGATVVGVSADSIARLNEFSADPQYCASKFPVATDPGRKIAQSFNLNGFNAKPGMKDTRGVEIDHEFTERTTFIITQDYKIAATLSSADDKITPIEHVEKSLAAVMQIKKPKS